jgi:DNA mismatch endonuclease (patch repair protein)
MDRLSPDQRSLVMSHIRNRDTKPERFVRRRIWSEGFRYARLQRKLPGTPDLVLPRYGVVVFVHGCFWHAHDCPRGRLPATNRKFWRTKLAENRKRDRRVMRQLRSLGWRCFQIWQCRLQADTQRVITQLKAIRFDYMSRERAKEKRSARKSRYKVG